MHSYIYYLSWFQPTINLYLNFPLVNMMIVQAIKKKHRDDSSKNLFFGMTHGGLPVVV